MSITVDRKVVLDLLGKARTGNDLLSVLDMIATTFTESTAPTPTLEEIEFWSKQLTLLLKLWQEKSSVN